MAVSEQLSHTAEVAVRVRASSFGELTAEAARALAKIQLGAATPAPSGPWRDVEVNAPDREAVLVDWLNELIYLAETERWVALEFAVASADATTLRMRARGATLDEAPARVKAATFHGLAIVAVPDGLEAEVVFDV